LSRPLQTLIRGVRSHFRSINLLDEEKTPAIIPAVLNIKNARVVLFLITDTMGMSKIPGKEP
ncbi:MAG: hypothetical protein M0Z37_05510, partial [Nitrospiraceae bacterium]|nr:hypothetical protein [Nitrospiraceae bacterium]